MTGAMRAYNRVIVGILGLVGCGESPVVDVLGTCEIQQVDHGTVPVYEAELTANIGTRSTTLHDLVSAQLLPNDGFLVANRGGHEIRRYSDGGELLWSVGADGDGPGEFRNLTWIGLLDTDSVIAFDSRSQRLSVFDLNGRFVRSLRLALPLPAPFARPVGMVGHRSLLVMQSVYPGPQDKTHIVSVDSTVLFRVGLDGTIHRYGDFPMRSVFALDRFVTDAPLWPDGHLAATGSGFYFGFARDMAVQFYGIAGGRRDTLHLDNFPKRETDLQNQALVERAQLDRVSGDFRGQVQEALRAMPVPPTLPIFGDLAVDEEHRVWLERFTIPGEQKSCWVVFDANKPVGVVVLPSAFEVYDLDRGSILGVFRDRWDVEHIQIYAAGVMRNPSEQSR